MNRSEVAKKVISHLFAFTDASPFVIYASDKGMLMTAHDRVATAYNVSPMYERDLQREMEKYVTSHQRIKTDISTINEIAFRLISGTVGRKVPMIITSKQEICMLARTYGYAIYGLECAGYKFLDCVIDMETFELFMFCRKNIGFLSGKKLTLSEFGKILNSGSRIDSAYASYMRYLALVLTPGWVNVGDQGEMSSILHEIGDDRLSYDMLDVSDEPVEKVYDTFTGELVSNHDINLGKGVGIRVNEKGFKTCIFYDDIIMHMNYTNIRYKYQQRSRKIVPRKYEWNKGNFVSLASISNLDSHVIPEYYENCMFTYPNRAIAEIWPPGYLGIWYWRDITTISHERGLLEYMAGEWRDVEFQNRRILIQARYPFTIGRLSYTTTGTSSNGRISTWDDNFHFRGRKLLSPFIYTKIKTREFLDYVLYPIQLNIKGYELWFLPQLMSLYFLKGDGSPKVDLIHKFDVVSKSLGLPRYMCFHHPYVYLWPIYWTWKSPAYQLRFESQTFRIRSLGDMLLMELGYKTKTIRAIRGMAISIMNEGSRFVRKGTADGVVDGRRESVSGHLMYMMIMGASGLICMKRYLRSLIVNIRLSRHMRQGGEKDLWKDYAKYARRGEVGEASTIKMGVLWHGYTEYFHAVLSFILLDKIFGFHSDYSIVLYVKNMLLDKVRDLPYGYERKIDDELFFGNVTDWAGSVL